MAFFTPDNVSKFPGLTLRLPDAGTKVVPKENGGTNTKKETSPDLMYKGITFKSEAEIAAYKAVEAEADKEEATYQKIIQKSALAPATQAAEEALAQKELELDPDYIVRQKQPK